MLEAHILLAVISILNVVKKFLCLTLVTAQVQLLKNQVCIPLHEITE